MNSYIDATSKVLSNNDIVVSILQCKGDLQSYTANWALNELSFEIAHTEPERAWVIILELLRHPLSDDLLAILAGGPLENILSTHGDAFIERVETLAKTDAAFRHILSWVWGWTRMPANVYNRLRMAVEG